MKILFLTNSAFNQTLADWLQARPEINQVTVSDEPLTVEGLQKSRPDLVISYGYRHLIKQNILDVLPGQFINLHISYLPFNRGADPNVWSFLENTPKGVSIHIIDKGIDTGDLLVQKEIVLDDDSSATLDRTYLALQSEIQKLFRDHWDDIRSGRLTPVAQKGSGTIHYAKEFAALKDRLLGTDGWQVRIALLKERYANYLASVGE